MWSLGFRIPHLVGVAMISGNNHHALSSQGGIDDLAYAFIDGFHRFDRCIEFAGMTHHVAIGVIDQDAVLAIVGIKPFEHDLGKSRGRSSPVADRRWPPWPIAPFPAIRLQRGHLDSR